MTSWINPVTFGSLDHSVRWRPRSLQNWHDASAWCDEHIGPRFEYWYDSGAEMQLPTNWYFKTQEQAALFALTWYE